MVTGIATAMLDSIPVLCITGQVGSKVLGSDAFQEVDITGITLPVTKHNYLVTRAEDVASVLRDAIRVATSGRPGPVLVDITKDAQQATADFDFAAAAPGKVRSHPMLSVTQQKDRRGCRVDPYRQAPLDPGRPRHHGSRGHGPGARARRASADPCRLHPAGPR